MQKNKDLENSTVDLKERPLLTAEVKLYSRRNEFSVMQLVVTKTRLVIAKGDNIQRSIPLSGIDALTISSISPEFIIHQKEDTDERFGCSKRKKDVVEMLIYLLATVPATTGSGPPYSRSSNSAPPSSNL